MALKVAVVWLAMGLPARAQPSLEPALRSALAAVPHAQTVTGACVVELNSGRTIFEHHADRPLIPASNMKVFVAIAALVELGADFTFETVFATDGTNLYLIGDGDPALGDERLYRKRDESIIADFERWADALLARGITTIPKDLVIDESIFDRQFVNPTWEESDLDNWYGAPVGGLNFNDNCVDITVSPAAKTGAKVSVSVQPENSLVRIVNNCRTGGKGNPILHHAHDGFEYKINGHCKKRWRFGPVSFPDPGLLTADALRTVLVRKGIRVSGDIRDERVRLPNGSIPSSLTVIGRHRTPLVDVLRRLGKNSQNLFAEALLKRVGYAWARRRGDADPQGSWTLGRSAVLEMMNRAGIDPAGLVVADGSGLSRENRCSARQLTKLLTWINAQPEAGLFRDSLSVAGVDGSLRKRLGDAPGAVYGKTGTMRGIRTLSGYVDGRDGRRFAFAILFNGYKGPSTPYKAIQDRVCRALIGHRPTNSGRR